MKSLIRDMEDPAHPAEPILVIADRPNTSGIEYAKSKNIKTAVINFDEFSGQNDFERQIMNSIKIFNIEIICLAGFLRILSPKFVGAFKNKILNVHPSILPMLKGLNTHKRALSSGLCLHGATVHLVTDQLDAGKILGQGVVPVFKNDTETTLAARVLKLEHKLYPLVLRKFLKGDNTKILLSELEEDLAN